MSSNLESVSQRAENGPGLRFCDYPGCEGQGLHRAPKSREALREYYWFCLDHIRAYNLSWNYYSGMNEADVERERRGDTVWHRPTWPFSGRQRLDDLHDPFGLFEEGSGERPVRAPATPEEKAMDLLELTPPLTKADLRSRYKELVKQHHPDANGGDRSAEERLKAINQAYDLLKKTVAF